VFRKICVIGIGTLGGFVCKHLAEQEQVKELIIIDDDYVSGKNIYNSIYGVSSIGENKVDCLVNLLKDYVDVTPINKKYIEGVTKIPRCDLVIDCRDEIYDRSGEINVRLFISGRTLIFDCRKRVQYKNKYKGAYNIPLAKSEINRAGFFAVQIINSETIKQFIKNEIIHNVELNLIPNIMGEMVEKVVANRIDMLYERDTRLHGIETSAYPIIELNKKQPIEVYVGEKNCFLSPSSCTNFTVIPKKSLNNSQDLADFFVEFLSRQGRQKNFIITLQKQSNNFYIQLLEETGAA
jgi:ThiF family